MIEIHLQICSTSVFVRPTGEISSTDSGTSTHKFTGDERDAETSLDHTQFRQYTSPFARWITPDPAGLAAVDPTNPQSWNRYAYVNDDPMDYVDPLGLFLCGSIWVTCNPPPGGGKGDPGGTGVLVSGFDDSNSVSHNCLKATPMGPGNGTASQSNCGGNSGGNTSGLTLGIRAPGQTYKQCLAANAHTYSAGGALELAGDVVAGKDTSYSSNRAVDFVAGNSINSFLFSNATDAGLAAAGQAPGALEAGVGAGLTYGRRTSAITSLNLAGSGGLPQALSSSTSGLRSVLGTVGDVLNLGLKASTRLGIDIGLTGAEAIGCAIPRS